MSELSFDIDGIERIDDSVISIKWIFWLQYRISPAYVVESQLLKRP